MSLRQVVVVGLALCTVIGASAADKRARAAWQAIGPTLPAIAVPVLSDPGTRTIYIGTAGGGIFKSSDGGATFRPVNTGLGGSVITGLAMVPQHPEMVYASTGFLGFYKTTDGGEHWTGGDWGGFKLVMDPSDPNVLYSASGPFDYVMKSVDGGANWFYASDGMGEASVFTLAIDPNHPKVLYAGSMGQGAFKSTDGALTWTPIVVDPFINALLVDPDNSSIVYAGTDRHGVYKSTDSGRTFTRIGSPRVPSILSLAKSGQTLYAGTATGGVSESADGGRTWQESSIASGYGNALSVDAAGTVFAGTGFAGAFARSVSDEDWRSIARDSLQRCECQTGAALAIDPGDHDHILLTTNFSGLLQSEDGGRTWSDAGEQGLTSNGPRGVAFDPQDPRRIYAGSIWGGGLFRSDDHGRHWARSTFGSIDVFVGGVAVDPVDHSVYAITAHGTNGLWKSADFGRTFKRIDHAAGAAPGTYLGFSGHTITVDPNRHTTVYFGDEDMVGGIWRSLDSGRNWSQVDASDNFTSITVDPTNSTVVYASASGAAVYPVLKSVDGGASFQPSSAGLPTGMNTATAGFLAVNPQHPNVLYVGGTETSGMFKSTDGARSWYPISSGLGDLFIGALAMDPLSPDTLYAATAFRGVYKTNTDGR